MKRFLTSAACVLSAISALAQGTVIFINNVPGVVVTHVYYDATSIPARFWAGNGPNDTPPGTHRYVENGMIPIPGGYAQLFAAPGENRPADSLQPASPITTFRSGAEAGFVNPLVATLAGVPADAPVATLQLRAWEIGSSWAEGEARGWPHAVSPTFNVYAIGGDKNAPPYLVGLQSFSLGIMAADAPEPSPAALAGLGALVFWLFSRRTSVRLAQTGRGGPN
jgi:hypothetical protein